jgi:uncharacterized protein YjdB
MLARRSLPVVLVACLSVLAGCANPTGLDSIAVSPTTQALTVGQTAQLTATGTFGNAKHPSTQNVSGSVTWTSSAPSIATVNGAGLVAAVGAGSATISANATAYNGPVSSSAVITVTSSGAGGTAGSTVVSLAVIPGSQTVTAPGATAQFLAIGTTSSGATVNLTSQVARSSSSTAIATIGGSTGLATAVGAGSATVTAIYSSSGTVVTGTATFTVTGGTSQQYTALSITPGSQALAIGQTGQFVALATLGGTGLQNDVTDSPSITWSSSSPSVAMVSATGLATGVSAGSTTITAKVTNPDNSVVTATATINGSNTPPPEPLLSLTIVPDSITVGNLQASGQFLAVGTFSTAPYVRDLTNSVVWITSFPNSFPVTTNCIPTGTGTVQCAAPTAGSQNGGVASAYGTGSANIIAEAVADDGSIQTAAATFNCPLTLPNPAGNPPTPGSCYPGSESNGLLSTLTVYNEGLNSTTWQVTAPSATGTANVLHCGPGWAGGGGSVCTATYPVGTTVTLTAPAGSGNFGGWSINCTPTGTVTAGGPNSCTVTLNSDDTVGAIFN